MIKFWREKDIMMPDVDNNTTNLRLQRDHPPEIRMKMRLLGCLWTVIEQQGVPDGWHMGDDDLWQ